MADFDVGDIAGTPSRDDIIESIVDVLSNRREESGIVFTKKDRKPQNLSRCAFERYGCENNIPKKLAKLTRGSCVTCYVDFTSWNHYGVRIAPEEVLAYLDVKVDTLIPSEID